MAVQFSAIAFFTFLAGIVQGVTGFGAGTLQMMVLPLFFPLIEATGISGVVCWSLTTAMFYRYRKYVKPKKVILPTLFYLLGSYSAISFSMQVNQELMQRVMGVFLLLLACYFLFIQSEKVENVSSFAAVIFSVVSGVCDGLFGIGGPLMVILFLAHSDSKEEYLGNSQALFFGTLLVNCTVRIHKGILTQAHIPYIVVGLVTMSLGGFIAKRIADRIDGDKLRRIVYYCVGAAGVINLLGI
ncbi:MAG: sulfite exporter TauE/SafE family protein [Oscillospiraceae bacterium]|nr:sulfite exporter TauE/SafE family protein [Oscillospiraceae bacterium]